MPGRIHAFLVLYDVPNPAPWLGFPFVYSWERMGRKGQHCRVLGRGGRNSRLVEFEDGYRAITSGNALRKAA
jgi:hypothetical protein